MVYESTTLIYHSSTDTIFAEDISKTNNIKIIQVQSLFVNIRFSVLAIFTENHDWDYVRFDIKVILQPYST